MGAAAKENYILRQELAAAPCRNAYFGSAIATLAALRTERVGRALATRYETTWCGTLRHSDSGALSVLRLRVWGAGNVGHSPDSGVAGASPAPALSPLAPTNAATEPGSIPPSRLADAASASDAAPPHIAKPAYGTETVPRRTGAPRGSLRYRIGAARVFGPRRRPRQGREPDPSPHCTYRAIVTWPTPRTRSRGQG